MPVLYLSYLSGMHFQSDDGIVHRERILVVVHFLSNYRHDESTRSIVYLICPEIIIRFWLMKQNPRQVNNKLKLFLLFNFTGDDLTVPHFQNKRMQNSILKQDL